ncbi:MAG: multicopper oxidase family protein [Ktedonobacteraceae bacterium]|nr:multicopper oxidase family protein [Ktedonobacteraceae bacterium]
MGKEIQTETEKDNSSGVNGKKASLLTRQPSSALSRIALRAFLIVALGGIGGAIAITIGSGAPSRDIVALAACGLLGTILVATRIRWMQALAIPVGGYLLYLVLTEPFVLESLITPKGLHGGLGAFIGEVLIIADVMVAFVTVIGRGVQNYRTHSKTNPRWMAPAFSTIAGITLGAIFIGVLSPAPAIAVVAPLQAPQIPSGAGVPTSVNMGMANAPTSLSQLQDPQIATHIDRFTLTAQSTQIALDSNTKVSAWTFNGTAPGPTLHVRQGDEVVVTLVNHLSFGVTIHWHGVRVPNAADGVAGVTQDAVKPGQSYVYRFTALDAGTYWYHSHQFSYDETTNGLFGMLIVDPAKPTLHADVDYSVALHTWNGSNNQTLYTMNATDGTLNQAARPGQWVRLRIVNTAETPSGNPQLVTLVGAPFQVVSLDGHDLNGPQWLNATPLPLGSAQRYDIYFQMPGHGSVSLVSANDSQSYQRAPALVIGQGVLPTKLPAVTSWFDLTTYGMPAQDAITSQSHFNATYNIILGNQMGTSLGRSGMTYTMNGKIFPDTGMIMVKEGQIIKLHFDNHTNLYHPMHLHGHVFTVLAENGKPLTGSPVHQDTVLVPPHATYDVAFVANNPGIWMLHCHNFLHANWGMDMMVVYNVSTPYTVGTTSGNFPD